MRKITQKLANTNQWAVMFWAFVGLQVFYFLTSESDLWDTIWSCAFITGFYCMGYVSAERDVEIAKRKV